MTQKEQIKMIRNEFEQHNHIGPSNDELISFVENKIDYALCMMRRAEVDCLEDILMVLRDLKENEG